MGMMISVRDVQQLPVVDEVGDHLVGPGLRALVLLSGGLSHLLPVLVGAREEEDLAPAKA